MIKNFTLLAMIFCSISFGMGSNSKNVHKIAIIDTGLDLKDVRFKDHLCKKGHKDFTDKGLADINGHGTFVAGLIQKYAGKGNYCFLIYKYYNNNSTGNNTLDAEIDSLKKAIKDGAEIVNFSGGGTESSNEEKAIIKNNPDVTFVVSAGNDGFNLDYGTKFYPASYNLPNIEVVGSLDENGKRASFSNYSTKDNFVYLPGKNLRSFAIGEGYARDSGTSYSTAIRTGLIIRNLINVAR